MSDLAADEQPRQHFLDRAGLRGFPWKTAITLYTISYGWLFIVRDSLWVDDWDLFKFPGLVGFDFSTQGFAPWMEINHILFRNFGPGFMRLLIFILFFGSGVFLFGVLQTVNILNESQRRFTALLFLLLPFNTARVALMTFHYTTAYFLFFAAWYLLVNFRSVWMQAGSIVLFFLSFQMHSLLFFFALPAFHSLWISVPRTAQGFRFEIKKFGPLLLLPLSYWLCRTLFWPEQVKYHDIGMEQIRVCAPFIATSSLIIFFLFLGQRKLQRKLVQKNLRLLILGLIATLAGLVPYLLYTEVVSPFYIVFSEYLLTFLARSDWHSRHQTLLPLGLAFLTVSAIGLIGGATKKLQLTMQVSTVALCLIFNLGFGFEYVVDAAKRTDIVAALESTPTPRDLEEIRYVDNSKLLNARGNEYRPRDWIGMAALAYGSEEIKNFEMTVGECEPKLNLRLVLIEGPETHLQALKNWVGDGDMGFKITIDDTPGACKLGMATTARVSGAIPILFYFTGAKN